MRRLMLAVAMIIAAMPALAHKVIVGVFPAGDAIEGEIGFSNGDMAAHAEVIVTGEDGGELGRVMTDADGFFVFVPTQPVAHMFRSDLGAGHLAEIVMPQNEVAEILGDTSPDAAADLAGTPALPMATAFTALTEAERHLIAEAVRDEIRPLRREIAAYKDHNNLQTILGGIGYIMGLFGLGFYLAARRKLAV